MEVMVETLEVMVGDKVNIKVLTIKVLIKKKRMVITITMEIQIMLEDWGYMGTIVMVNQL